MEQPEKGLRECPAIHDRSTGFPLLI